MGRESSNGCLKSRIYIDKLAFEPVGGCSFSKSGRIRRARAREGKYIIHIIHTPGVEALSKGSVLLIVGGMVRIEDA
jgi:hypothetical protein